MSLWFYILFVTLIFISVTNGKKNNHRFSSSSGSFPIQVSSSSSSSSSSGSSSSSFPEFLLYPKTLSNNNNNNGINSNVGSGSISGSNSEQCRNSLSEDYCTEDDVGSNLNDKMNFLLKLERNDDDSDDNTQKNHQEIMQFLMNEMQLSNEKRGRITIPTGCDCQVKSDVIDLGYSHFPRYLINAVCQERDDISNNNGPKKCRRGSECKPIEYRVRVLTYRTKQDLIEKDHMASLLPEILRPYWKFKTITVAAGCFCSY